VPHRDWKREGRKRGTLSHRDWRIKRGRDEQCHIL
jgi:hypothetical protein